MAIREKINVRVFQYITINGFLKKWDHFSKIMLQLHILRDLKGTDLSET